jgi:hypothetical protein
MKTSLAVLALLVSAIHPLAAQAGSGEDQLNRIVADYHPNRAAVVRSSRAVGAALTPSADTQLSRIWSVIRRISTLAVGSLHGPRSPPRKFPTRRYHPAT